MNVETEIYSPIFETEDQELVEQALRNVVPLSTYSIKNILGQKHLYGRSKDKDALNEIFRKIREQRILDAGRKSLRREIKENTVKFWVQKQAAKVGKINFCQPIGESPLGTITVNITSSQIEQLIDWLVPYTREGREVNVSSSGEGEY